MKRVLKLDDFDYELPRRLIAQRPHSPRDRSRLMVLRRKTGTWEHARFADLPDLVSERDLLVLNDSRVLPARLAAVKETGGQIEVLLLDALESQVWRALLKPGRRARAGDLLTVHPELLSIRVLDDPGPPVRQVRLEPAGDLQEVLERVGRPPLPPYIQREVDSRDREAYQTVYAAKPGSAAAPTAGLHFTEALLSRLNHCKITLHVGYGTFQPIVADRVEDHRMHSEYYEVSAESARRDSAPPPGGGARHRGRDHVDPGSGAGSPPPRRRGAGAGMDRPLREVRLRIRSHRRPHHQLSPSPDVTLAPGGGVRRRPAVERELPRGRRSLLSLLQLRRRHAHCLRGRKRKKKSSPTGRRPAASDGK